MVVRIVSLDGFLVYLVAQFLLVFYEVCHVRNL